MRQPWGTYQAKRRERSKKKIDLKGLEEYVRANEDMTLKQAAKKFHVSMFSELLVKKVGL